MQIYAGHRGELWYQQRVVVITHARFPALGPKPQLGMGYGLQIRKGQNSDLRG